jgi:hypothetical protein
MITTGVFMRDSQDGAIDIEAAFSFQSGQGFCPVIEFVSKVSW